jgi:hypothetical protein
MSLTDQELDRLADLVRLQPTKNAELEDAWGFDSGSEVYSYLQSHFDDYYLRDQDSLIRATPEAAELVDIDPEGEGKSDESLDALRVPQLQYRVYTVLAGPEERSESVVSVLGKLRGSYDIDPEAKSVRKALRSLERKNIVEVVSRTVSTFRLATARESIDIEETTDESNADDEEAASESRETPRVTEDGDDQSQTDDSGENADVLEEIESDFEEV